MSTAVGNARQAHRIGYLRTPVAVLAIVVAALAAILTLPLNLPIGPMYWDLFIYFDAANRIFNGQVPVVDFFAPVGPLGYYLFAGGLSVFPDAQPLLLVEWSLLAVTAPLMAIVIWHMDRQSRGMAFAVLVPFLIFAILPFNTREYYPYPGSDGFGIYNRQVCQILYALVAGLVFVPRQRALAVLVTLAMTALFFTKITGFVAGFVICAFAFAAGRLTFRHAVASALAFFAILGVLEIWRGLVSHYATDILTLVEMNSSTLLPRFMRAASHTVGIVAPAGILALLLLWRERDRIAAEWRTLLRTPSWNALTGLIDKDGLWICAVLLGGVFFETQNTGSQALIFLWPLLLAVLAVRMPLLKTAPALFAAMAVFAGAAALPPLVNMVERAARTYVGAVKNVALEHENLKTLGHVTARPEIMERTEKLLPFYAEHRDTYRGFVDMEELPAYMFYSEFDFQLSHLMAIDRAITDIRALEAEKGIRFDTIMELNFVDPFPYLMDRRSAKYIAIGADPTRAVPDPGTEEDKAVRNTDLVLYPTCPLTTANRDLYRLYEQALADHKRITIDACFDGFVSPRFADEF